MTRHPDLLFPLLALALLAHPAAAQIDYRNLDDHRPVRTEDAYPVERHAFELLVPYGYENGRTGEQHHTLTPELSYGAFANTQLGIKLPFAEWELAGPRLFGLLNFNTESPALPAFSLRGDLTLPWGELAGRNAQLTLKGIATRSWGRTRLHANAAATVGKSAGRPLVEAEPRWAVSLAADHTLLRRSLLAIGELGLAEEAPAEPTTVTAALGVRYQLTPTLVVDAGAGRRLTADAGPDLELTLGFSHAFGLARSGTPPTATSRAAPAPSREGRDEWFYFPGDFNWRFLALYPEAARLFNAFDYGHAVLYETLLARPREAGPALAGEYAFLTRDLLVRPPRFAIAEEAVMPAYAKRAWRAKQMFDWAHVLHRQIYDVYADDRLAMDAKDSIIERLTDDYLSREEYAFAAVPKSMSLMDEQPFSRVFRRNHPDFNGLIWAYHWLQVGLYEPLIAARSRAEAKAGIGAALARFWDMVHRERYPTAMPMTSAIAPEFSRRHPRAAIIFDNLHMMHDIISDVLASPEIPDHRKREVIYEQLAEFRSAETNVMSLEEWWGMAAHMGGLPAMGGPATGLLAPAPAETTAEPAHPQH